MAGRTVLKLLSYGLTRRVLDGGFYGSWQMVGQGLAVLIGALLGALLTRSLAAETLDSWGWRVPFLLGLFIGPVGLFIRRHLQETEAFLEARGATTVKQSFGTTLATHVKEVLVCTGIITSGTISSYVILFTCRLSRARNCICRWTRPSSPSRSASRA